MVSDYYYYYYYYYDYGDDMRILQKFGSHLRLSLRHTPEDLDSSATPLREPEILQNVVSLKFEVVRETVRGDTTAGETGYWLLFRGNRKSRPGIR
jgi:hypothetical protein